jgi:hypothetical protein
MSQNQITNASAATTAQKSEIEFTGRARAFSGQGLRTYRFMLTHGELRVWDSVADHYTTCHSLTPAMVRRLAKSATRNRI